MHMLGAAGEQIRGEGLWVKVQLGGYLFGVDRSSQDLEALLQKHQ